VRPFAFAPFAAAALLSVVLAGPLVSLGAQQSTPPAAPQSTVLPIVPGARVKVSATTLVSPLMANYLEMKGDTAVFIESSAGRGIWTFTLDQITKVEQSQGDKRNNKGPMIKGAAIGVPIGALLFWGTTGIINTSDSTRQFNRAGTAAVGAAVGAVVGAIVGSRIPQEHWMALPLPKRVSFNPFRRDGGMEVKLGFSF
jgi:hypothetical protein